MTTAIPYPSSESATPIARCGTAPDRALRMGPTYFHLLGNGTRAGLGIDSIPFDEGVLSQGIFQASVSASKTGD